MTRRYRSLNIALALALLALAPACYTLFQHPRLAELDYARPQGRNCRKCHSTQDLWSYTHPRGYREPQPPWRDFYEYPSWLEDFWKEAREPQEETNGDEGTQ